MVEREGKIIDWDKYSMKIDGKRIFLIGGEFHYWRAPDKESWAELLKAYKAAGLNCVRIYFHWGFHQPDEDEFDFDGNRDVSYLLSLCEELGLYVLVASGPYICAETNAGGFPLWLLQKRHINVRHMTRTGFQKYDDEYVKYCKKWFKRFIQEIREHQITENEKGCVIGFQIENEYPEKIVILKGQEDYMMELKDTARNAGISVPIFHNDFWENNSWNGLVDLYGFDKYLIHADKDPKELPLEPWSLRKFMKGSKNSEKDVSEFGPPASQNPMFIPELQGGWYNHWKIKYDYDELYDFYGDNYQKLILETMASQRTTMMSLYMFYGGTNYGTIANPEVYTSYDYGAAIREFIYESNRMKYVRLFSLFARSFQSTLTATEPIEDIDLDCSLKNIVYRQRRAIDKTDLYFLRNFNKKEFENFYLTLLDGTRVPKIGEQELDERHSFIAVANHKIGNFKIKFCSLPIILKGKYREGNLLVVMQNGGELLLEGTNYSHKGYINSVEEENFTRFSFVKAGFDTISSEIGDKLYIMCLEIEDALTLNADLESEDVRLTWGSYASHFTPDGGLELYTIGKQDIRLLCCEDKVEKFKDLKLSQIPGMKFTEFGTTITEEDSLDIELANWQAIKPNCAEDDDIWKPIDYDEEKDPLDHGYLGAHTLYRWQFTPSKVKESKLKLNVRHKAGIWVNGQCVGEHDTYKVATFNPFTAGSMNGPDPTFLGSQIYEIGDLIKPQETNTIFVLTESLGQNKQFFPVNDVRNPRGILKAKINEKLIDSDWFIAGKDVIGTEDPYGWSGLPGQDRGLHKGKGDKWVEIDKPEVQNELVWLKANFQVDKSDNHRKPLRLHLEGQHNISIFLNGHFIGRYWGGAGPQHDFYLMDGYLQENNTLVLAAWSCTDDKLSVHVKPYIVNPESGNIDENGTTVLYKIHKIRFKESKPWTK